MRELRDSAVVVVSGHAGHTLSRVERRLLPVLGALAAEGATIVLVAAAHGPLVGPARDAGVAIAPFRVDRFNKVITRNRVRTLLRRYEPVAAVSTGYHADIPLRLAARDLPVPVICATHCGAWPVRGTGALTTWGRRRLDRRTRSRVDAWVVDCAELARLMEYAGVAPGRIHVDPPSVDVGAVMREAAEGVAASAGDAAVGIGEASVRPLIGYAGALERSRGLGTLATAVPAIRARHPDTRTVIAGEGIARLGLLPATLDGRVELLGGVRSVPALLAAFDVCVFPSAEPGVPGSLLEAAALGKPIVASDVAGIRELFADGAEIVLVPQGNAAALAEAVCSLLDDPARARALGVAARARVMDEYTVAGSIGRWTSLLRQLG